MTKVGRPKKLDRPETRQLTLHTPLELIEKIDHVLNHRMIQISRHTWMLEALREKAEREKEIIDSGKQL